MKVHSNFTGPKSKKHLIAFSCVTALASFAFIARPAFAEEAKVDNSSNLDTTATTTANVETTSDLVETKVVEAPATTEKAASTESTTNVSEQATTSTASSETASETASTTASESQAPAESASGQTREAVTTDRATNEATSANETSNSETNVTGGQYYSDAYGHWHYKDASGKDLTGPQTIDGVKVYFRDSGVQVKGEFAWDGHYYDKDSGALVTNNYVINYNDFPITNSYVDENGNKVIGSKEINGVWNYFDYNGRQLKDRFDPNGLYYDKDGKLTDLGINRYFQISNYWYYIGSEGKILKGPQTIDGIKVFFDEDGKQVKGNFAKDNHYYDKDSGELVTNNYANIYSSTYYLDENGYKVTGHKVINGIWNYFDNYGEQVKDRFAPNGYYYDKEGKQVDFGTNRYFELDGKWYYAGNDGAILKGAQTIDGVQVYFDSDGRQIKGKFVRDSSDYKYRYYDKDSGALVKSQYIIDYNKNTQKYERYYVDENGIRVSGPQTISGASVYFSNYDGHQLFNDFGDGHYYNHYGNFTDLGTNRYVQIGENWYYVGNDGKILTGEQTIDNAHVYFDRSGKQVKGGFDNNQQFHDKDSGNLVTNRFVTSNGKIYFIGSDSRAVKGATVIDNIEYLFDKNTGEQIKGGFVDYSDKLISKENYNYNNDPVKFYEKDTGALVKDKYFTVDGKWYYSDNKGKILKGPQTVHGVQVYFDRYNGQQIKGTFADDGYFYDKNSGAKVDLGTSRYVQVNDNWYYIGNDGKTLKGDKTIDGIQVHFDTNTGQQIKGGFADKDGKLVIKEKYHLSGTPMRYYDKDSGALVKDQYFSHDGKWYYADAEGNILKGSQTIDGVQVYFDSYGVQAKDAIAEGYYYDKDSGARHEVPRNQFIKADGKLYYFDSEKQYSNYRTINGKRYYIKDDGEVLRGSFDRYDNPPYFDDETGAAVEKPGFIKSGDNWYYVDEKGNKASGLKEIDGKLYYFSYNPTNKYETHKQIRGALGKPNWFFYSYNTDTKKPEDNPTYYFDAETGAAVTNQFIYADGHWYYFGKDGKALLFDQVVNGQHLYFDYEGKQVKGDFVTDYKGTRYYDENSGELVTNQTRTINGVTYHFDENGRVKQL